MNAAQTLTFIIDYTAVWHTVLNYSIYAAFYRGERIITACIHELDERAVVRASGGQAYF